MSPFGERGAPGEAWEHARNCQDFSEFVGVSNFACIVLILLVWYLLERTFNLLLLNDIISV